MFIEFLIQYCVLLRHMSSPTLQNINKALNTNVVAKCLDLRGLIYFVFQYVRMFSGLKCKLALLLANKGVLVSTSTVSSTKKIEEKAFCSTQKKRGSLNGIRKQHLQSR